MSYLYTNENTVRDAKFNNLYDLINPIVVRRDDLQYYGHIVTAEEEMRPDLICYNLYNKFNYVDEFLTWNNILNPWSIKQGQIVFYLNEDDILTLQLNASDYRKEDVINTLVNPNKDTKKDPNREQGTGLTPTIKPAGVKEVEVDYNNKKIKIMNSFQ
jgi:hypothetical protein